MQGNKKEKILKAIDTLYNEYDAFYICNKYGTDDDNTHKEEFELLSKINAEHSDTARLWIKNCYDCHYKDEYTGEETAFAYLKQAVNNSNSKKEIR